MIKFNLKDMIKGWFVGNITPTAYKTNDCEVAYKTYKKGEYHKKHFHKIATEITVITKGKCKINNEIYSKDDILIINQNEITDCDILEDMETVVVKIPGANDDKYEVE